MVVVAELHLRVLHPHVQAAALGFYRIDCSFSTYYGSAGTKELIWCYVFFQYADLSVTAVVGV